ncbi:hypothetical protein BDF21DRAFT_416358 [Thamnidium elegans]|nr:hypothetical protein BDF21DRAFT_416358 [Thamnidium elegans]
MATTHDVHRVMEENLFGAFQRQPSFGSNHSFRSLTASDLVSLPTQRINNSMPLQYKCRPSSDILQAPTMRDKDSPEAEAIDRWFENIQRYEQMLEEVAAASLDQGFKDELHKINQWLRCRSDAERTATLYTIVQNASQIQIRFLITVLQQLASNKHDPYPAGQENSSVFSNPNKFTSHSVISTESEYEARKRQMMCPPRTRTPLVSSAVSEPDDLRRRNRDLFVSRPLGLSHPGPLLEKALAARAQLKAMNVTSTTTSTTASTLSSSSSASSSTGGLFSSPPRLRTSCSTDLSSKSLFNDTPEWPFPLQPKKESSWSFGSLQKNKTSPKKKEDLLPWAIQEEVEGLSALEQAQARLRQDKIISPPVKPVGTPAFLPPVDEDNSDDESDSSSSKPLTGLARRRKRSSAARALKDKLAAETVDFDLMKDVQNWLRSLRLHKYGHAFIGLNWPQVVRMSDQDMIDAGVNTIGARRKLLKVFENVQRHCNENAIDF